MDKKNNGACGLGGSASKGPQRIIVYDHGLNCTEKDPHK